MAAETPKRSVVQASVEVAPSSSKDRRRSTSPKRVTALPWSVAIWAKIPWRSSASSLFDNAATSSAPGGATSGAVSGIGGEWSGPPEAERGESGGIPTSVMREMAPNAAPAGETITWAEDDGRPRDAFPYALAWTIAGGSTSMRNFIVEQGRGLPRGPLGQSQS